MSAPPVSAAERQRRRRDRERSGAILVRLNVSSAVQQALIEEQWSDPAATGDPHQLASEIADFLDCWAEGRLVLRQVRHGVTGREEAAGETAVNTSYLREESEPSSADVDPGP
jgi:hypothetical protein